MGWVHPRKDFQFTQKRRSGPCERRKSPSQPLFSLLRPSAASPPTGRLYRQLPRSPVPAEPLLSVPQRRRNQPLTEGSFFTASFLARCLKEAAYPAALGSQHPAQASGGDRAPAQQEGHAGRRRSRAAPGLREGPPAPVGPCPSPGRSESGSPNTDLLRASRRSVRLRVVPFRSHDSPECGSGSHAALRTRKPRPRRVKRVAIVESQAIGSPGAAPRQPDSRHPAPASVKPGVEIGSR